MNANLKGKSAIITGASSGIGRATARLLAAEGCKVVLAARSESRLIALEKELGPDSYAVPTDVTRNDQVQRLVDSAVERFGKVDILLANAGIFIPGEFASAGVEDSIRQITVNVEGVLRCIHAVVPRMTAQGSGDIIVTSSISGVVDIPGEPVYSASKHAVQGLAHTLRQQLAPAGIRVGAVSPGIVLNEIWGITDEKEIERRVAEHSGIRSEDVAASIIFMLSQPPHVTIRDLVILPQNQDI